MLRNRGSDSSTHSQSNRVSNLRDGVEYCPRESLVFARVGVGYYQIGDCKEDYILLAGLRKYRRIRTICMNRAEKHRDECTAPVYPVGFYECHKKWRDGADDGRDEY